MIFHDFTYTYCIYQADQIDHIWTWLSIEMCIYAFYTLVSICVCVHHEKYQSLTTFAFLLLPSHLLMSPSTALSSLYQPLCPSTQRGPAESHASSEGCLILSVPIFSPDIISTLKEGKGTLLKSRSPHSFVPPFSFFPSSPPSLHTFPPPCFPLQSHAPTRSDQRCNQGLLFLAPQMFLLLF